MALEHIRAARSAAGLDPVARHVLLVVATYANDTGHAWPSIGTLAADTGYHPSSIRRILDRIALSPAVEVIPRIGKTSVLHCAPWEPKPRALGNPTPRPRARRRTNKPEVRSTRAVACAGENLRPIPAAWSRITDPDLRAEVLELAEQLRMEV